MRAHSLRRISPLLKSMGIYLLIVVILFAGLGSRFLSDTNAMVAPVFKNLNSDTVSKGLPLVNKLNSATLKNLLFSNIPALKEASDDSNLHHTQWNPFSFFLFVLTGIKLDDPVNFLQAEVPVMNMVPIEQDNMDDAEPDSITDPPHPNPQAEEQKIKNDIRADSPLVAFYCTHSSETYQLTEGIAHVKGKAGAVMEVAKSIAQKIQDKYKIPTIYSDKIHDTAFNKSYVESQKTVKDLLANNKSLRMLFDIHRDSSLPRERTQVQINGKSCAKVLIVVGTDARAEHPRWRENLALARKLAAKMDELYPGLSRGISVKKGRYNQQYSTSALLLEIGSLNNTKEEALNSASLIADVIVSLLNDEK
ncbi:stage II sporulation protein P [Thermincola potens JR]|uniref:Stage II sporulation protein P n=2 Tax=Thermincola TaxID=278993 RepID=D5XAU4_THEPJ|nr:stage II sporulation protein P [Thermincola potens JR]